MNGLVVREIGMDPEPIACLQTWDFGNRQRLTLALNAQFEFRADQIEGSSFGPQMPCQDQGQHGNYSLEAIPAPTKMKCRTR